MCGLVRDLMERTTRTVVAARPQLGPFAGMVMSVGLNAIAEWRRVYDQELRRPEDVGVFSAALPAVVLAPPNAATTVTATAQDTAPAEAEDDDLDDLANELVHEGDTASAHAAAAPASPPPAPQPAAEETAATAAAPSTVEEALERWSATTTPTPTRAEGIIRNNLAAPAPPPRPDDASPSALWSTLSEHGTA